MSMTWLWGMAVGLMVGIAVERVLMPESLQQPPCTPPLSGSGANAQSLTEDPSVRMAAASSNSMPDAMLPPRGEGPMAKRSLHETPLGTKYDVTLFYRAADMLPSKDMPNITFVAHVTIDRIPHVRRWCRLLRGPMSISVFVRPFLDDVRRVMSDFGGDLCIGKHAHLHLVTEANHEGPVEDGSTPRMRPKDMHVHYPSNVQRNAALDGCVGDLALLMDIDFYLMPSSGQPATDGSSASNGTEEVLRALFEQQRDEVRSWAFLSDEANATVGLKQRGDRYWVPDAALYVIPAIETVTTAVPMPDTIDALARAVTAHQACAFYGHYCKHCHHPTNLKRFLAHSSSSNDTHRPYLIDYEERFEPYVILNKSSVTKHGFAIPRYNESFLGRFGDKYSYFYELYAQRRPFVVLTDFFLVHHGRGNDVQWPKEPSPEYRRRERFNEKLFGEFKLLMNEKYDLRRVVEVQGDQQAAMAQETSFTAGGSDCCVRGEGGSTTAVVDRLLLRATTQVDWAVVSSDGRGLANPAAPGAAALPFSCIATHRELLDADADPAQHVASIERLQAAVSWACERMDCNPLIGHGSALGLRYFPRNLVAQADWVFGRWAARAASRGESIVSACKFNGAARLAARASQPQHDADASGDALLFVGDAVVGCTVNPDAAVTQRMLLELIDNICADPPEDSMEAEDARMVLGRNAKADVVDRIGGNCTQLFEHIDPLVADDLRVRASVALNAHHLIFTAGGEGRTCRDRFGVVAAYLRI